MRNTKDSTKLLSTWPCNSNNQPKAKIKFGLKQLGLRYLNEKYRKKPKILKTILEVNLLREKKGLGGLLKKLRRNTSAKSRDANGAMVLRDLFSSTLNSNIQNSTSQNHNTEIPNRTMIVHHQCELLSDHITIIFMHFLL